MTRQIYNPQMQLGSVAISQIEFNLKSRDDIPKILKGLQYIYITPALREKIFSLLEERISPAINKENGRPGMELWKILVMGILRLDLNGDYDRLHELVNHHGIIRKMLGHANFFDKNYYELQTIKDNVSLLTPELLEAINTEIVNAGHALLKKKENAVLRGRCDSFVVETDVHYPTDINLLFDATRKVIQLTTQLCDSHDVSSWRPSVYNVKQVKRAMRKVQKKKRVSGRTVAGKEEATRQMKEAHRELLALSGSFLDKSEVTLKTLEKEVSFDLKDLGLMESIKDFSAHATRQIDQIKRRVIQDEIIPHREKVFSLFQPHTEWISKGKAGVPVELGLRVCLLEDHHQFILHHRVMEKETDEKVAVAMVCDAKKKFPLLSSCSFDKGFHTPDNHILLAAHLDEVALKRKGKLSKKAKATEATDAYKAAKHKHSAVESAINALEVQGLDTCRDHGIAGFKRYVALAIVARNIHRMGVILHKRECKQLARKNRRIANDVYRLVA